ncbi:MAG: ribonuclease R [Lachnospiraceae bacterium]|nr:ribonuclease R [Lachnospiraceae bacterium]
MSKNVKTKKKNKYIKSKISKTKITKNKKALFNERKNKVYGLMCDDLYVPMKIKELATVLNVSKNDRADLDRILEELIIEGKIEINKRGKYQKAKEVKKEALEGKFISHPKGFGFVEIEGREEDLYIPESFVKTALHGDVVKVELLPERKGGKRQEAKVVEIVDHEIDMVVGQYQKQKNFGFVVADNVRINQDIFIPQGKDLGAVDGHIVVCQITKYGKAGKNPEGVITEILGHRNDPGVDIMSIIKAYGVPTEFEDKVLKQATNVAKDVSEADMAGRLDLRNVPMVTIDGEDSKDLDDAISLEKDGENYKLGVHIADVTNYVQENSALDVEAKKRGTSVYLVDRVIPMLPHTLSNGICSLNQGEDRLALSCIMTIDKHGKVIDHEIAETVVNIDRRMTYTAVAAILDYVEHSNKENDEAVRPPEMDIYADFVDMFVMMRELSEIIRKKRDKRGAIDFDFPEAKIIVDEDGHPTDILLRERNMATKIIEDFMLSANETVAKHFYDLEIPFLYRNHGVPDGDKIEKLSIFLGNFGYHLNGDRENLEPKELQKLLKQVAGKPEAELISKVALRSMQQARYTVDDSSHFGLAAEYYCHFTSPIRRYPDLQIHRIIKENLRGRYNAKRKEHYESLLPMVANETSKLERRAEEVEREVDKLKKVEYLSDYIGEHFTGTVSGVTQWGIYVELLNTIEGMIPVASLKDDYYNFVEDNYELVGEKFNKHYTLGQVLDIEVVECNRDTRTIDFKLLDEK